MAAMRLSVFALGLCIIGVSQAQYYGRMRGLNTIHKDHCTCTCEDLTSLIALARALDERDKEILPPPPSSPCACLSNFEDLIMKLVNALVYTTTETTKNTCRCPHSVTPVIYPETPTMPSNNHVHNGGYGNGNEMTTSSSSHYSHSDGGLINADILKPNKNNNVLDVDISNHNILGVMSGGGGHPTGQYPTNQQPTGQQTTGQHVTGQHPTGHYPTGQQPSGQHPTGQNPTGHQPTGHQPTGHQPTGQQPTGQQPTDQKPIGQQPTGQYPTDQHSTGGNSNSGQALINVDLLNSHNKDNVAEVGLGNEKVLGIGIGGGGTVPNSVAPNNNGYTNNAPNSGGGLINVDLLDPHNENNIADVDIGETKLLGVGK